jgi:hypothetical protein
VLNGRRQRGQDRATTSDFSESDKSEESSATNNNKAIQDELDRQYVVEIDKYNRVEHQRIVTSAYVTSAQNHLVISNCQIFTKELKDQKDQKDQENRSLVFSLCYTAPIL